MGDKRSEEPVKAGSAEYVLYSHWAMGSKEDVIEEWVGGESPREAVTYLEKAKMDLRELLRKSKGILVLFFDPGWKLALIEEPATEEKQQLGHAMAYADAFKIQVEAMFPTGRVRVLTVRVLKEYIDSLRERERPRIYRWLVGTRGRPTYDSPKIVEAFLRVRLQGAGIPVLRADWDVLVNIDPDAGKYEGLGIPQDAIKASLAQDKKERIDIFSRTWVCSAGYTKPSKSNADFESWSRGFATRIQPALKATREMCRLLGEENDLVAECGLQIPSHEHIEKTVAKSFDSGLASRFLGVEKKGADWAPVLGREPGISSLGANPLGAVISGALLNLSASAILDLPPFSNMTRGVMWIDDYLKFELHDALGHLQNEAREHCRVSFKQTKGKKSIQIFGEVVKGRSRPQANVAAYYWANYLPILLLGLVMDSWIRKGEEIGEKEEELWGEDAPLVFGVKKALATGHFGHRDALELEQGLRDIAIRRIARVYEAWAGLNAKDGTPTLASAWATGKVKSLLRKHCPKTRFKKGSRGLGLVIRPRKKKIESISDLATTIQQDLRELIWDAIDYILLTLSWPGMVQGIRAVETSLLPLHEKAAQGKD